jgi:tetratricopeptide (TPR) repeat protein
MTTRIKNLMHRGDDLVEGCGFLRPREIDAYLDETLPQGRRDHFDRHQMACPACALLAADLDVFRDVDDRGPLESERSEFGANEFIVKAHLRHGAQSAASDRRGGARFRFAWNYALGLATAAMIVALVAVPMLWDRSLDLGPPTLDLPGGISYEVQAMPFSERPAMRGQLSLADLWQQAGAAYTAGDFQAAEPLLAAIIERAPEDHDAKVYRGNALIMLGRYDEAVSVLRRARALGEEQGLHGADANYFLGIAAFKAGNAELAREALENARDAGGHHGREAARVLDGLR